MRLFWFRGITNNKLKLAVKHIKSLYKLYSDHVVKI
jgi:hypothetical protein